MDAAVILGNTLSQDAPTRQDATARLEAAMQENYAAYVIMLSAEVANEQRDPYIRNAAGIALKNAVSVREPKRQIELATQWLNADPQAKAQVKQNMYMGLHSSNPRAGSVAAQVIAAIAAIELPVGQWPDLIETLLGFVNNPQNVSARQTTMQAIGFICETVKPEVLATRSNEILTAIVQGARKEEPSPEVQLAAVNALYNSLEFVRDNFEREGERNYIMQVVCEATQSTSVPVQVAAFECLVKIMSLYYDKMAFYMERALFGLTVLGMRSSEPNVALQAIEFWSTVCDEEADIMMEASEMEEVGEMPLRQCRNFAKIALQEILPVLLTLLSNQEEGADDAEDEWDVAMAAAHCLTLLAQTVTDDIVPPVVPYIESHIKSGDWHQREAAVMAFGSILDGPSAKVVYPLVTQGLPIVIEMMRDPSYQVKDTTAWTLGRICDIHMQMVQADVHLHPLLLALVAGIEDRPRIAANCCWALMNLAVQLDPSDGTDMDKIAPTGPVSAYFEGIIAALWRGTERTTNEFGARTTAYEAISTFVEHCTSDNLTVVANIATQILMRLETLNGQHNELLGQDDLNNWSELISNICGVIIAIARKTGNNISVMSDRIMTIILQLVSLATRQTTVMEDAFLVVGAMASALDQAFLPYLNAFLPYILNALKAHEEPQLCTVAVGLIGDICRALGEQAAPYCNAFMSLLLEDLQSDSLARSVKVPILSAFGDVALAIGPQFEPYLNTVMEMLKQASSMEAEPGDLTMQEYISNLRDGIIDAYTGIIAGLKPTPQAPILLQYVGFILDTVKTCIVDDEYEKSDQVMKSCFGIVGDLAEMFPRGEIKDRLLQDWLVQSLKYTRPRDHEARRTIKWAREMVKNATR